MGLGIPASSEEGFGAVSSDDSCRFTASDVVLTAQIHTNPETSLERLIPLVEFMRAWKPLPNISHWVLQTIEKGYQIQFGSRLPRFMGVLSTEVAPQQFLVIEQEIKALLEKGAI